MYDFKCPVCGEEGGVDKARECLALHFPEADPHGEQSGYARKCYQEIVKYIKEGED